MHSYFSERHSRSMKMLSRKEARDHFAILLPASDSPVELPDLSGDLFEAVLYILIAAVLAVLGEAASEREELLDILADRESDYWTDHELLSGLDLTGRMLQPMGAMFTLLGRASRPSGDAAFAGRRQQPVP